MFRKKKFKVTVSSEAYPFKPKDEISRKKWAKDIISGIQHEWTIEELGSILCDFKHSFNHGIYKNNWICAKNFQSTQMIVVDIDNGLSPQEAINRLEQIGLSMPNLIYRTLSDPTDESFSRKSKLKKVKKYRMIFCLDSIIYDYESYNRLIKEYVYSLFPEADKCHPTQNWYGGKEVIYENYDTLLNIPILMCALDIETTPFYKTAAYRKKSFKKNLSQFSPILFSNGCGESVSNLTDSIYNNKESVKNETGKIRDFDFNEAGKHFKLLEDFLTCKKKIKNPQLFGLLTSMIRIRGGVKLWKACIKENKNINDTQLAILQWMTSLIRKGDFPPEYYISSYAPDDPACHSANKLTDFHFKRAKKAILLKENKEVSLDQAENELKDFLDIAFNCDPKKTQKYVCRAPTAIGKTELILNKITDGCILSVPTHYLAEEISGRLNKFGKKHLLVPQLPELPKHLKTEYDKFYKVGGYISANLFIKRHSENTSSFGLGQTESLELQSKLKIYLKTIEACRKTKLPIITTHKRLIHGSFPNHHTVIIDEDIRQTLFELDSFSTKDLRILLSIISGNISVSEFERNIVEKLLSKIKNKFFVRGNYDTELSEGDFEHFNSITKLIEKHKDSFSGNLIQFFQSNHFTIRNEDEDDPKGEKIIHYVKIHKLPEDKKIILLSATVDEDLYEKILGGKVNWKTIPQVEHVGDRIQYSNISFSRQSLNSKHNMQLKTLVKAFVENSKVITFLKNNSEFGNTDRICLENCSGIDKLKSETLAVLGTNHLPDFVYQLLALALGIDFDPEDLKLRSQHVNHNGYRFYFKTYDHLGLRKIQFHCIETSAIQAVGRNRSLRENATVTLFSNFPLPGFEQSHTDELKVK